MFTYIWGIFINHIIIYFALLIVTAYLYIREDAIEYIKKNKKREKENKERKTEDKFILDWHNELDTDNIFKSLWTGLFWPISLPYLILYKVFGNWIPKFIEAVVKTLNWWFRLKKKEK